MSRIVAAAELSPGGWVFTLGGSLLLHAALAAALVPLLQSAQTRRAETEIIFSAPPAETMPAAPVAAPSARIPRQPAEPLIPAAPSALPALATSPAQAISAMPATLAAGARDAAERASGLPSGQAAASPAIAGLPSSPAAEHAGPRAAMEQLNATVTEALEADDVATAAALPAVAAEPARPGAAAGFAPQASKSVAADQPTVQAGSRTESGAVLAPQIAVDAVPAVGAAPSMPALSSAVAEPAAAVATAAGPAPPQTAAGATAPSLEAEASPAATAPLAATEVAPGEAPPAVNPLQAPAIGLAVPPSRLAADTRLPPAQVGQAGQSLSSNISAQSPASVARATAVPARSAAVPAPAAAVLAVGGSSPLSATLAPVATGRSAVAVTSPPGGGPASLPSLAGAAPGRAATGPGPSVALAPLGPSSGGGSAMLRLAPAAAPEAILGASAAGGAAGPGAEDDKDGTGRGSRAWRQAVDFVRGFRGGGCFAAMPVEKEGAVGLEAFSADGDAMQRFAESSDDALADSAGVSKGNLATVQCGAVDLARSSSLYPDFTLSIALEPSEDVSDSVRGEILGAGDHAVHLFVIDEGGEVQTVAQFAAGEGAEPLRFEFPFSREELAEARGLFLAVASDKPLSNLRFDIAMDAPAFFDLLRAESKADGAALDIAMLAFDTRDSARPLGVSQGNEPARR